MSCAPCGIRSSITDSSAPLINNFTGSQFAPLLTGLLRALDQVEIKMRSEQAPVSWKPSQFPQDTVPYGRKPQGTSVVRKATPLYFEENDPYVYEMPTPGVEGGICAGQSLCGEPPANQVPGDTYQTFTWRMSGTAFETPTFCLKDLLFYENGPEYLRDFLANVERTPFQFYDNYIRNLIWETGEKYILGATDVGLLWNSPDRVTYRRAPNLDDFRTVAGRGTADAAAPKLAAIQHLKYILEDFMGDDVSNFQVGNQPTCMMVGTEQDLFAFAYNDTDVTPASWAQGGMGFNLFSFRLVDKLPFGFKSEKLWFRGDFDPTSGEFYRISPKVYVDQNGGKDLRTNPAWLTAKYGILTFMTARPFVYKRFAALPSFDSKVPKESLRLLAPRFQFVPLMEKCNYNRGLVAWRAEDEFGFAPTGEKIIHVIYRRDELGSYIREAKAGECIDVITSCATEIPTTCSVPQPISCVRTAGAVVSATDYRDTAYTVEYDGDIVTALGWDIDPLPIAKQFQTIKGVFDVLVTAVNAGGNIITMYVNPTQHTGGHFCCTDQLLGFISTAIDPLCAAGIEGGLRKDPWVANYFHAQMTNALDTVAAQVVKVFLNSGCGQVGVIDATVVSIDNGKRQIKLSVVTANFPNGLDYTQAVQLCASATVGCADCLPSDPEPCTPTVGLTPITIFSVEEGSEGGDAEVQGLSVSEDESSEG